MFLTPKAIDIAMPARQRSPVVGLVGAWLVCTSLHLWNDNPAAGEQTQGYLHGGLLVDFVGESELASYSPG